MPDQRSTNPENHKPAQSEASQAEVSAPIGEQHTQTASQYCHSTCNKNYSEPALEKIRAGESLLAWVGVGGIIVNIVIACIYFGQLTQMRHATEAATQSAAMAAWGLVQSEESAYFTLQQMEAQSKAQQDAADASERAAKTARQALTSVQRAFIAFSGSGNEKKVIKDGKTTDLTLSLPWINGGDTQTRGAVSQINFLPVPVNVLLHQSGDLPSGFSFPDEGYVKPRQFFIAAKGNAIATETIPIYEFYLVSKKQFRLYTWGWITYHDIFDGTPTHLTEFCDELVNVKSSTPDMTDPSAEITVDWEFCEEHNCSDEECRDYKEKTEGK
jgi:hypothetical protein